MLITELEIQSYIEQFKVDRETAIEEVKETLNNYYEIEQGRMQEVYQDIIRNTH